MVAVEGDTDIPFAEKLLADAGLGALRFLDCGGKDRLDRDAPAYNAAARGAPWFVLRDLDHDAACAPDFLAGSGLEPNEWMCFRIAVREIESWLLADHEAVASFFRVRASRIPPSPDAEADPTEALVNLSRTSRRARVRKAMVPSRGGHAAVGPLYEATIIEFARDHWSVERASLRSPSLAAARRALKRLGAKWREHIEGGPTQ